MGAEFLALVVRDWNEFFGSQPQSPRDRNGFLLDGFRVARGPIFGLLG